MPARGQPSKTRRVTQACDFCHRRGLRCKAPSDDVGDGQRRPCLTCVDYGQDCTWSRQPKRRGTKPKTSSSTYQTQNLDPRTVVGGDSIISNRRIITALLDVYLDSIHPIFPFFCERQLWVGWRDGTFPANASDYTSLLCMCALSAQHVGSGALFSDNIATAERTSLGQDYLAEALRSVSMDYDIPCINQIRSFGFLTLLGTQTGNHALAHKYLAAYHGLTAHFNLHDEAQWPLEATDCDVEVRRRLWWIMYRLEVHMACVRGSTMRCPEAQSYIGYPKGTHHPAFVPGRDGQFEDWFSGWNATTDLYRVLEHVIVDFRARRRPTPSVVAAQSIPESLNTIQQQILPHLGSVVSRSSDSGRNRCGFQASNILCTIHLARMISVSSDNDFQLACETAQNMVKSVGSIPIEYIRAAGSPLMQQITGVGHLLAGLARKQTLTPEDGQQLREILSSMEQFLSQASELNSAAANGKDTMASLLAEVHQSVSNMEPSNELPTHSPPSEFDDFLGGDIFEGLLAEMNDDRHFFSTHLTNSLSWPYESQSDHIAPAGGEQESMF